MPGEKRCILHINETLTSDDFAPLPCGHTRADIVGHGDGTYYCQECEREAQEVARRLDKVTKGEM